MRLNCLTKLKLKNRKRDKMGLRIAIEKRDMKMLKRVVKEAVSIYGAKAPKKVYVETLHGDLPFEALIDEDSKWKTIEGEYCNIIQAVDNLPKTSDKKIEIAKLIASSAILRNINTKADKGLL